MPSKNEIWAGTEDSLLMYETALKAVMSDKIQVKMDGQHPLEQDTSPLLQVVDGVGLLTIKGTLVNRYSPWNPYMGVVSYEEIQHALSVAASDSEIKGIILNMDTPGGAVAGIADTAKLIREVDSKSKPVWTYTGTQMASGGYWLGVAGRKIYAAPTSTVGSIGVISVHSEYSKMDANDGVTRTVIRAGKYKTLANPVEPLTEDAKAEIQTQLDAIYGVFVQHVADYRKKSYNEVDTKMAQGRVFVAATAVDVGLIDKVAGLSDIISEMRKKVLDNGKSIQHNQVKNNFGVLDMNKKALELLQLLASGTLSEDEAVAAKAELDAIGVTEDVAAPEASAPVTAQEDTTSAPAAVAAPVVTDSQETNNVAMAQITQLQNDLVAERVKTAQMEASFQTLNAQVTAMTGIVKTSLNSLRIALGAPALGASDISTEQLVSEHVSYSEQFRTKFKVGGVAAVEAVENTRATVQTVNDSKQVARIDAVRVNRPSK